MTTPSRAAVLFGCGGFKRGRWCWRAPSLSSAPLGVQAGRHRPRDPEDREVAGVGFGSYTLEVNPLPCRLHFEEHRCCRYPSHMAAGGAKCQKLLALLAGKPELRQRARLAPRAGLTAPCDASAADGASADIRDSAAASLSRLAGQDDAAAAPMVLNALCDLIFDADWATRVAAASCLGATARALPLPPLAARQRPAPRPVAPASSLRLSQLSPMVIISCGLPLVATDTEVRARNRVVGCSFPHS
jgi:hypothetical protein